MEVNMTTLALTTPEWVDDYFRSVTEPGFTRIFAMTLLLVGVLTCLFSTYFLQSWCVCCAEMCNNSLMSQSCLLTSSEIFILLLVFFYFPWWRFRVLDSCWFCHASFRLRLASTSVFISFMWSDVHPLCLVSLLAVCKSQKSGNIFLIYQFTDWKCALPVEMSSCYFVSDLLGCVNVDVFIFILIFSSSP